MAKKSEIKALCVDLPSSLFEEFDECCTRLGLIKKRAVAAALEAFVTADIDQQLKWYRQIYARIYGPDVKPEKDTEM